MNTSHMNNNTSQKSIPIALAYICLKVGFYGAKTSGEKRTVGSGRVPSVCHVGAVHVLCPVYCFLIDDR